jgi:glycosyltransferase involved in cell wall biosynthesis
VSAEEPTPTRRLKILYVLDSAGSARAGGLVSGDRVLSRLRAHHDVVSLGVNGDIALEPLSLPLIRGLVAANSFTFARPRAALLYGAVSQADVVHVQLPFFLGFAAMRAARELGVPVVAAHHVQPENALASLAFASPWLGWLFNRRPVFRLLNRLMVAAFYRRADLVVCPSVLARDELLKAGLKRPTAIISNGAPERFKPLTARPAGPFTVLSVGRLVPEKRHDVILEAARRSRHARDLRVVIAGKGPLELKLRSLAMNHPSQVRLGFVDDDALLALYQSADMYVHASEVELEGMAPLEAMRCGCPSVIADSPASATRQFALDARHLFPPGDPDALARRIDEWFEHREQLPELRAQTVSSVSHYGLAQTVDAYEGIYAALADRRRPALPPMEAAHAA